MNNHILDDYKVVKIDRTSPCSMEYYVQVIHIFGARPMYHFETRKDAVDAAKEIKKHIARLYDAEPVDNQDKAIKLLKEYSYSDENKKRDMEVFYV